MTKSTKSKQSHPKPPTAKQSCSKASFAGIRTKGLAFAVMGVKRGADRGTEILVDPRSGRIAGTYIRKRGNSAGINIPTRILSQSGFSINSEVSVEATEGQIVIKKTKPPLTLDFLLANSPKEKIEAGNKDVAWFFDEPRGREII